MHIGGFQKFSLLDYPGKICAIVFTQGCNFKCPYCHNPELIDFCVVPSKASDIIDFLKTRQGKLDAVVITGGEPTLQSDLKDFILKIKELNYLVKLDTNGTNPSLVEALLEQKLLDYVAMDIKSPLEKYPMTVSNNIDLKKIRQSIDMIMKSGVDYEFRTTVVREMITTDDFEQIGELIKGAKRYYLQKFVPSKILDTSYIYKKTYSDAEFEQIRQNLEKKYVLKCYVR